MEEWAPVVDWDLFYEVSNLGRVRSVKRLCKTSFGMALRSGNILTPIVAKTGYLVVNLTRPGIRKQETVHSLVLAAFVGKPPAGWQCCHNDGNRANAALSNLRYDTVSGNHADKKKHGTWQGGENNPWHKFTEEQIRAVKYYGIAPFEVGMSNHYAYKVRVGEVWKHV